MESAPPVPTVDLALLPPGDPGIGAALAASGFVILEGHGVASGYWSRAYAAAERVFALPADVKARYIGPQDGSQRGFLPVRASLPDGRPARDHREAWHVRREGYRVSNILPDEVPELRPASLELIRVLDSLVDRVLESIDAFLGNPSDHLAAMVRGAGSLFRINHYPDGDPSDERARFSAHRDFGLVTLLVGATKPGLEIQTHDGTWFPVTPSARGIVLSAGDALAVESDHRIPSTLHRVVAPRDADGGRLSMVYFVSPRPEIRLRNGVGTAAFLAERLRDFGYRD